MRCMAADVTTPALPRCRCSGRRRIRVSQRAVLLLVHPGAGRLADRHRGAGRRLGLRLADPAVAPAGAGGHRGDRRRPSRRDAALALSRAPVGTDRRCRLHQIRLVDAGVADRAGLPHPDRRHRARPDRQAVPPDQGHRDDGVRGRTADHRRSRRAGRSAVRRCRSPPPRRRPRATPHDTDDATSTDQ